MAKTPDQRIAQLRATNKEFLANHVAAHNRWRRRHLEVLRELGLSFPSMQAHFVMPQAYHEKMASAQGELVAALEQAKMDRHNAVQKIPRTRVVLRAN